MIIPITRRYCNDKGVKHHLTYEIITTRFIDDDYTDFCPAITDGRTVVNYGIKIIDTWSNKVNIEKIENISTSKQKVMDIMLKMVDGIVTPITARDIVEDYISI